MLHMGIGMLAMLAPIQVFIGDQHGLNTLEHQPIKIAAMEGHWDGTKPGTSGAVRDGRTRRPNPTCSRSPFRMPARSS